VNLQHVIDEPVGTFSGNASPFRSHYPVMHAQETHAQERRLSCLHQWYDARASEAPRMRSAEHGKRYEVCSIAFSSQ
jgi:hypothetical protein